MERWNVSCKSIDIFSMNGGGAFYYKVFSFYVSFRPMIVLFIITFIKYVLRFTYPHDCFILDSTTHLCRTYIFTCGRFCNGFVFCQQIILQKIIIKIV